MTVKEVVQNRINNYKTTIKVLIEENENSLAKQFEGRLKILQSILEEANGAKE